MAGTGLCKPQMLLKLKLKMIPGDSEHGTGTQRCRWKRMMCFLSGVIPVCMRGGGQEEGWGGDPGA